MMSSMHKKALALALLGVSAAAVAAGSMNSNGALITGAVQSTSDQSTVNYVQPRPTPQVNYVQPQQPATAPQYPSYQTSYGAPAQASQALSQWRSLRQSDGLPFTSYASFLTRHRGWPGETGLRKTAERAINPQTERPSDVVNYFRVQPALTPTGHARHAFALMAQGNPSGARMAARQAWLGGVLQRSDEDRLIGQFGSSLTTADHDARMEKLLANGDTQSAERTLAWASPGRRPVYEARLALHRQSSTAPSMVANLGSLAYTDAGVLMDRARYLRDTGQSVAARSLLAQRRTLTTRPGDVEKWYEVLLASAKGAANDRNWTTAYQIASQIDDAYAPGTVVSQQSAGERDDYTSLAWLAGVTALDKLNRPSDAAAMFLRYARGGRSAQVTTKGLYWAGRAAQSAGQQAQATVYFTEAARFPELFYGQLALERLGRPVPAPALLVGVQPTEADRAAFNRRDVVEATRLLGQMGRWEDQSLFVRNLAETAETERDRILAAELARTIGRADLGVWLARSARNDGEPFYARAAYPEARIPAGQSQYWSLANGIIRQESSFDRAAVSPVGARGMMQLMPGTAREVAGKLGLSYDAGRLTRDPEYNIQMGSHYFAQLMNSWGGSAPLAVASYNAGAGNVRKWIRANGDPRMPGVDVIRWIEEIPFSETRGYVQRVLENAVVYDAINPARARTPERTRLSYYLGKSGRPG